MEDLFDVSRGADRHRPDVAARDAPPGRRALRDRGVLRDDARRGAATGPAPARLVRLGDRDRHRHAVHQSGARDGSLPRHRRSPRGRARRAGVRGGRRRPGRRLRDLPIPPHPVPGHGVLSGRAPQFDGDRVHRRSHVPRRDLRNADRPRPGGERLERRPDAALRAGDPAGRAGPRPVPPRDDASASGSSAAG